MPYTQKTLADIQQSLADRHDSGVLPTSSTTLTFWTRLLNRGQAYCADKLRMVKSTSLTTSGGTIALPDDFLTIRRVYDSSNNESSQVDQDDLASHVSGAFWITGNHSSGFSLNTTEDKTYTVEYTFKPVELSGASDVCIIPDPEAVVAFAYSFLRKSETDPIGDAESALQECDNRLVEMQSAYNVNNNFTGFITLEELSNKYHWE